jgi:serine/threonine protein kinase
MLKDEANILVSINDSNIAQVYDLGRIGDSYFIAMEYVHGLDLSHVIKGLQKRNQFVPIPHALYIGSCMCAGLHAAHTNTDKQGNPLNIVHRDVSPHNVIISYAGDVKLIDFGVAKAAVKESHTQMGVIKGKLLYMAPEQAMAKALDGRADLFAVGLCMYKMLTNELPFSGENEFQVYNNILSKEIVPPRELNPQVPQEVNQVVMTLLQRDPDKRYQDGYSAKQDLRRALHNIAPGYTVNRLGRFIEENFSEAAIRRQQDLQDASGPNGVAPQTPSANSVGTGQLLADADLHDVDFDTQDTTEAERLQIPAALHANDAAPLPGLQPPPTAQPDGATFRTQNSDESTGNIAINQLAPQNAAPARAKKPLAVYTIALMAAAIAVLLGYALVSGDATTAPDAPSPTPESSLDSAPTNSAAADPAPNALSPTVRVVLDSTPSGAKLFRGADLLGVTPHELTLRRSAQPIELSLRMSGYSDKIFRLVPDENIEQVIALTPAEAAAPTADLEFGVDDLSAANAKNDETTDNPPAPANDSAPERDEPEPVETPEKTRPDRPAPRPEKPTPPPEDPSTLDLWGDGSESSGSDDEPKKSAPAKKPAEKKDQPKEILNPFG